MTKTQTFRTAAERFLLPAILLLYPLVRITQGIDITDSTYSPGIFRFFDQMEGTWVLATYLANAVGNLFTKLPLGYTLLGLNLYTALLIGGTALISYFALKKRWPALPVFAGELIAISLCWCPTTVLYNYMTYLLFTAGFLSVYRALCTGKGWKFFAAGVCLGLNVMVRFPNIVETSLILGVWFYGWLRGKKVAQVAKETGLCAAGFAAGFLLVFAVISVRYGAGAYTGMIGGLFGMTESASDYTLAGMLGDTARAYLTSLKWAAVALLCLLAGILLFAWRGGVKLSLRGEGRWAWARRLVYAVGLVLLLRFYWGRGMYTFRYYDYESMFQWGMLLLLLAVVFCAAGIGGKLAENPEERALSLMTLILIAVTPLGSNNYTFPNLNNLFVAAPFCLVMSGRLFSRLEGSALHFPVKAMTMTVLAMTMVQGALFFTHFAFRDGILGDRRTAQVDNNPRLSGMWTTEENAAELEGLTGFIADSGLEGKEAVFWGEAPGLSFILDMPPAIFTSWPELDSNPYGQVREAILGLEGTPPVIWRGEDAGGGGTPAEGLGEERAAKEELIREFMREHGYREVYRNEGYAVYQGGSS